MRADVAILAALAVAYGNTWVWLWNSWQVNDYYSHGPIVALLVPVLLWFRRADWGAAPGGFHARAWWLLAPALLVHLVGALLMIDSLSALSLAVAVPATAWLLHGGARTRRMLPVLMLVVFAIPLPLFVTGRVAFELKEFAVSAALLLGDLFGIDAVREGAFIRVPGQEKVLLVADPCSGLRSLVALTTVGYCLAFLFGERPLWRRLLLVAFAVPIALLVNVLRITAICALARLVDVDFATGTGHDVLGVLEWFLALALLVALDVLAGRLGGRRS